MERTAVIRHSEVVATVALLDRGVALRVYRAGQLAIEVPLSWRRALVIGSDMINAALIAERADLGVLKASDQRGVTPAAQDEHLVGGHER
jgi:hypothetical protein